MSESYIILDHKEAESFQCENCDVFVDGYAVVYKCNKEVECESKID